MKLEGEYQGIPIYSSPDCPEAMLYLVNDEYFYVDYPLRKDGKPDMRYGINKLQRALKYHEN